MALQIVCLMRDREIQFSALAGVSVLCSQMRLRVTYFILNLYMYSEQPRVTCREVTKLIITNYHKHPSMPLMSQYVKVGLEYRSLDICTCDIFCIQCRIYSVSS